MISLAIDHEISISPADFGFTKKIRASKPEDDVCLRPVLAEWSTQRSRQEQEVLLSQSQTHVRGVWVVRTGAGLMSCSSNQTLCLRWAKDTRVVLVSSLERRTWTTVRPLPTKKPIPSQFEVFPPPQIHVAEATALQLLTQLSPPPQICMHVTTRKKCQYVGNCTFAHSVEEKDLWTYMKENNSEFSREQPLFL